MKYLLQLLFSGMLLSTLTFAVEAKVISLCETGNDVIFSCTLDNGKIVSLCSKNQHQFITYHYGKSDRIELSFPGKGVKASDVFNYALYFRYQTEYLWINFKTTNFEYTISRLFSGEENPSNPTITYSISARQISSGKNVTEHYCKTLHKDKLSELKGVLPQCNTPDEIGCKP